MARLARVAVPGLPHHITQRGNRPPQTFLCDVDYGGSHRSEVRAARSQSAWALRIYGPGRTMATHLCPGSIGELGCQLALAGENSQLASGSRSGPLALYS